MPTNIKSTDEFGPRYSRADDLLQDDIASVVGLLEEKGTKLGFPYSSEVSDGLEYDESKIRVLRIQSQGRQIRIFYCFDPKGDAILLAANTKTADKQRFYQGMIRLAHIQYSIYLEIERKSRSDMSVHQSFSDLTADFSPQRKAKIAVQTQMFKSEMALNKLRKAFSLTQGELASELNVEQPAISRLERRSDMYISRLREVIESMGGKLEITARFDNDEVKIINFDFFRSSDDNN